MENLALNLRPIYIILKFLLEVLGTCIMCAMIAAVLLTAVWLISRVKGG